MFPQRRMRRMRRSAVRPLLTQTVVRREDLIAPVFVDETTDEPRAIQSMPGQYRYPVGEIAPLATRLIEKGIKALLIFGIPSVKDETATGAFSQTGIVQRAVRSIKDLVPEMVVITDVCACEYTSHGHCGIVGETAHGPDLLNDPSLDLMGRIAVSHANAGADIVAPSCMLDGMVGAIRSALDRTGHDQVLIMSYSSKFASSLYGPFRDAAESAYTFGDRKGYQINPANRREALMEAALDLEEGADILMVKPGTFYLDILSDIAGLGLPVAAYQVSGEYSMIKAAGQKGWLNEREVALESLTALKRAGADLIITYFAYDAAGWLNEEQ
ncbi:MAG: porphobilinogen synthase [Methanomicrobiales archaeon]|jgi:porphobilinogen synthase|nr:porphobilinogen synthase [Methanomicrobiales archaeon]